MMCPICKEKMEFFFEKKYGKASHIFSRCVTCGMVINETVYKMTNKEWKLINDWHKESQGVPKVDEYLWNKRLNRLNPQVDMLVELMQIGIIKPNMRCIDYAGGDALFARMVHDKCIKNEIDPNKYKIGTYEKYMRFNSNEEYISEYDVLNSCFDIVISSAVLEHLIGRTEIDRFFDLVNEEGIVIFHTLICEEVPKDPNWFYIDEPVHCTLWTNEAMRKLYIEKGFQGCAYHVDSKMWIFLKLKDDYEYLKAKKRESKIWVFSKGFVDYWKVKPYHLKSNSNV